MPRKTTLCDRIFQEEGVYGDITIGEFPVDFIPFDSNVLSLELPNAFRVSQTRASPCDAVCIAILYNCADPCASMSLRYSLVMAPFTVVHLKRPGCNLVATHALFASALICYMYQP